MSGIGFWFDLTALTDTSFLLTSMQVTAGESFFPEMLSQSTALNPGPFLGVGSSCGLWENYIGTSSAGSQASMILNAVPTTPNVEAEQAGANPLPIVTGPISTSGTIQIDWNIDAQGVGTVNLTQTALSSIFKITSAIVPARQELPCYVDPSANLTAPIPTLAFSVQLAIQRLPPNKIIRVSRARDGRRS